MDGNAPPPELLNALARMGLAVPEGVRGEQLTGGVSSDIWRIDLPEGPVCVKRALAKLKVAADWRAPVGRNAFEAELTSALDAGDLLDRAPELVWLKPYLHGTSRWTIGVTLPKLPEGSHGEPPALLSLHSDLQGTRLQFPAPLDTPAAAALR